jgi:NDP-sugar pyrophosphorylase family protein
MINIDGYIAGFSGLTGCKNRQPWEFTSGLSDWLQERIKLLDSDYIVENLIAIHKTAVIETGVTLKPPVIIGKNCFIGSGSYLRNGVFLVENVRIGTGCEIKSSIIFSNSAVAHFNFIGDTIVGNNVNFEAGSITANHYNERKDKNICVLCHSERIDTRTVKFGSLVGDNTKIGANAVLSPGTIMEPDSIVKRLELIEQIKPASLPDSAEPG